MSWKPIKIFYFNQIESGIEIWAASWQNQQNDFAPSEDRDQPGHPPSLIRVFTVRSVGSRGLNVSLGGQEYSDQTGRMPRLIWVFAGRTNHFVGFVIRRLIFSTNNCPVTFGFEYKCDPSAVYNGVWGTIWQVVPPVELASLDRIQRKALCLCLGLPNTAGREAVEVASGTIPLDPWGSQRSPSRTLGRLRQRGMTNQSKSSWMTV